MAYYRQISALKDRKRLFELTNFELSDGFCYDLIANAHGPKILFELVKVRIIGFLNYWVLTVVPSQLLMHSLLPDYDSSLAFCCRMGVGNIVERVTGDLTLIGSHFSKFLSALGTENNLFINSVLNFIINTYSMKQPDLYYFETIKMTSQA